jgi:hypothetical protein
MDGNTDETAYLDPIIKNECRTLPMITINFKIFVPNGPRKEEVVEQKESNPWQHSKELNAAPFPESSLVYPDSH